MRLTVLLSVFNAEQHLSWIGAQLAGIGDELVIGIDDATQDSTAQVARSLTDRICYVPHEAFLRPAQPGCANWVEYLMPHCHGDWILRIEHDETLSPHWRSNEYVQRLLGGASTHYWIPRRWALPPGDRYISNRHWYPDYQLRMFRNAPSLIKSYPRLHAPQVMAGEGGWLTDAWIVHWDCVLHHRPLREKKVLFYQTLAPYSCSEYYLFEEQTFETRPLDWEHAKPHAYRTPEETGPFDASIEFLEYPATIACGQWDSFLIAITNLSNREFYLANGHSGPANVRVSYHWYTQRNKPEVLVWDGDRCEVPARLAPGEVVSLFLRVKAPVEPGEYLLQPDLVEEHVAWFSSYRDLPTLPVRVI